MSITATMPPHLAGRFLFVISHHLIETYYSVVVIIIIILIITLLYYSVKRDLL